MFSAALGYSNGAEEGMSGVRAAALALQPGSDAIRAEFPIVTAKTYLASHSLGAVPRATSKALQEYYDVWAHEGILAWDGPFLAAMKEFTSRIERILNAEAGSIIALENVTRGFAAIASAIELKPARNRIVLTDLEFSTSYPFFMGLERHGAEIVIVRSRDGITVPVEDLIAAIDERTALVQTSHVYFRSGAIQDLRAISMHAHSVGAHICGDGYQTVGTVPVDVRALGVDFYVGGSHKWLCGGPGAAYLYVAPEAMRVLTPTLVGWFALKDPFAYEPGAKATLAQSTEKFYGGTPSIPALYAAREGNAWVERVGLTASRAHSMVLGEEIVAQAKRRGLTVRSPLDSRARSGMVCIDFDSAERVSRELNSKGIILDYRPNCGIRVSPHFYSNAADLERFFNELDRARG